jgi:IMP dehydrogenase
MAEIQDYKKAFEVLAEYRSRDGLHIDSLLDSEKHGALTYNDFLILPGSISKKLMALDSYAFLIP